MNTIPLVYRLRGNRTLVRLLMLALGMASFSGIAFAENPVRQALTARTALEKASSIKDVTDSVDATIPAPEPPATQAPAAPTNTVTAPATTTDEAPATAVSEVPPEPATEQIEVTPFNSETEVAAADEDGRITISLDDVSLEDTVRMFAQTSGANIISAPNLFTGKYVSVNLVDVDWLPALRSILEIHNFTLTERTPGSGVFSVTVRGPDAPEPTQIKTFFLDYTTSGEVKDPVQKMLISRKDITSLTFNSRNAIVVRSTESNLGELDKLIGELDRPGKQILIEAKIMELNDEASKQLGIKWDSLESFGIKLGSMQAVYDRTSTDVRGDSRNTANESVNSRSSQSQSINSSEATDTAIQRNNELNGGYTALDDAMAGWSSTPAFPSTTAPSFVNEQSSLYRGESVRGTSATTTDTRDSLNSNADTALSETVDSFTRTLTQQQTAILEMSDFQVILSALERTEGVSVVSNPKMIVTSGSTNSFFKVGEREPIIRTRVEKGTTESPGDTVIAELDTGIETDFIRGGYLETGIDLGVIATVKTDDYIEAAIRPVLRRMLGQKVVADNTWPIISVKEINTSFTLRSGQTVAIGGLTDTVNSKETTKVPVLGSIPVLGRLFSHTADVKRQVETIIFVTLSVADPVTLERVAGIPENAQLVHSKLIRDDLLAQQAATSAATTLLHAAESTDPEPDKPQPVRKKNHK